MSRIEAVIFDIGNVLLGWQPEAFYDGVIGPERRREMFANVDLDAMNQRIDLGDGFRDIVYDCADANPDWADEIRLWHDRWIDMLTPVITESVAILKALKGAGVTVHALTNFGGPTFDLARARHPFLNEFDRAYVSAELRMVKPDAAIYAHVEADCGVAPDRLLFTDDRPENIEAARQRGWQVHLFDGPAGWRDRLVAEGLLDRERIPT